MVNRKNVHYGEAWASLAKCNLVPNDEGGRVERPWERGCAKSLMLRQIPSRNKGRTPNVDSGLCRTLVPSSPLQNVNIFLLREYFLRDWNICDFSEETLVLHVQFSLV